jgi:hypothetical protein
MKSLKVVRVTFVVLFGWLAGVNFTAEQGAETGAFLSQSRSMMIAKMCHEFLTAPVQHERSPGTLVRPVDSEDAHARARALFVTPVPRLAFADESV